MKVSNLSALLLSSLVPAVAFLAAGARSASRTSSEPASAAASQEDPWEPFRPLVGTWRGTSEGKFGPATLTTTWEFVLDGKFLQSRTRSVSDGEVHEDLGMLSYDEQAKRFVYRAFYSEGYVNTFRTEISEDGTAIVFETVAIENAFAPGLRARDRIEFDGDDTLHGGLDLATGEEPYVTCVSSTLERVD